VEHVCKLVLVQLTEDMFVLPTSVLTLFKALDSQCASRGMKTPHNCVGVKVRQGFFILELCLNLDNLLVSNVCLHF